MAVGLCSVLKSGEARQSPPEWAGPSGYISVHFAIGSQVNSTEAMTLESCSVLARQ